MKYIIFIVFATLLLGFGIYSTRQTEPAKKENVVADTTESVNRITLDLSEKGLTEVPQYFFNRVEIEVLDLSNNNLTGALQAEVRHLENLKVLDLSNNQFTGVPAEIGQLQKLEVLDLSDNNLTGLPHELGNLTNLKLLDISGNNYSKQDVSIIRNTLPGSVFIKVE